MKKIVSFLILFLLFNLFSTITVSAAQTINVKLIKADQGTAGKWNWEFDVSTENIPDSTPVKIALYQGTTEISTINDKINNNYLDYFTGYVLDDNTNYTIIFTISQSLYKVYVGKTGTAGIKIPPTIVSFSPATGIPGNTITITGSNFIGTTNILFGQIEADMKTVSINDSQIKIEVPVGTTEGKITVKTPNGSSTSPTSFKLTTYPTGVDPQPQADDTTMKNYTLLAPIMGLTEIEVSDIGKYFNTMFNIAIGLCAALAVIMMILGAIQYMGEESIFGKTEGKHKITTALFGLIIALGSYALLNTINPDLLGGNGLNVDQVSAEIDPETETTPWSESATISGTTKTCTEGYTTVSTYGNGSATQPKNITVCKSISTKLKNLIDKAKSAGYVLSGYGARSYNQQVKLRTNHNCPDIYNSPSSACKPPTARPGHSKHESGKAVDFTCNGASIAGTACFQWLKSNVGTDFKNLASEPWHWSDDGK